MITTPRLNLPYLAAAQAQKHITHNEALLMLDGIVQLAVSSRSLSAPPSSPVEGARYCVAASPTGEWSGKANKIAVYQDTGWVFYTPIAGWVCYVTAEAKLIVFDGTVWNEVSGSGGSTASLFGINATADTTNRLALASDAALFSHNGSSHRLKVNKAAASDTASVIFQDAASARAELGLCGSDDFAMKVSADGTSWITALSINKTSGVVSMPQTSLAGGREVLTANRTYYVRTDGSNSNNGLMNTAGGAFLTLQKAIDVAVSIDPSIYTITIQIADGTYTGTNVIKPLLGSSQLVIQGNSSTPANVVISTTSAAAFQINQFAVVLIKDLKIQTSTIGSGFLCLANSDLTFSNINFGACATAHIQANSGPANIVGSGNYVISGAANWHVLATAGSTVTIYGRTITITGTPAFASSFVNAGANAYLEMGACTFSGSATGKRYHVENGAYLSAGGGGANYFPGNSAGTGTNFSASPWGLYT